MTCHDGYCETFSGQPRVPTDAAYENDSRPEYVSTPEGTYVASKSDDRPMTYSEPRRTSDRQPRGGARTGGYQANANRRPRELR